MFDIFLDVQSVAGRGLAVRHTSFRVYLISCRCLICLDFDISAYDNTIFCQAHSKFSDYIELRASSFGSGLRGSVCFRHGQSKIKWTSSSI